MNRFAIAPAGVTSVLGDVLRRVHTRVRGAF